MVLSRFSNDIGRRRIGIGIVVRMASGADPRKLQYSMGWKLQPYGKYVDVVRMASVAHGGMWMDEEITV